MVEAPIRVREFAKNCGCTPQNIYGHLKTYAADLEGHTFQGKGRQGVLLDGYAQDFLRSVMYPKEIADNALMDEINELRAQVLQLGVKNTELSSKLALTEGERDKAVYEAGYYQRALAASKEAEEAKDAALVEAKEEAEVLRNKLQSAEEARQTAEEALAKDQAKQKEIREGSIFGKLAWAFGKGD